MDIILDKIIELLTSNMKTPRGIKQIYFGDPIFIPQRSLPAITVNPEQTAVATLDTASDEDSYSISVILVYDAREFFNKTATESNIVREVADTMEERNTDGTLKTDTILGVIRKNLYDDAVANDNIEATVDYGYSDARDFPTIEASLTFTVRNSYLRT